MIAMRSFRTTEIRMRTMTERPPRRGGFIATLTILFMVVILVVLKPF